MSISRDGEPRGGSEDVRTYVRSIWNGVFEAVNLGCQQLARSAAYTPATLTYITCPCPGTCTATFATPAVAQLWQGYRNIMIAKLQLYLIERFFYTCQSESLH